MSQIATPVPTSARTVTNGTCGAGLRGRRGECDALDGLLARVRTGRSPVLVLRGEAGAGKTALLEYLLERASGCRIVRAAGAESETDLTYAGLQQFCAPMLDVCTCCQGPSAPR